MTTEEKLKHFQDICTSDAKARSDRQVDDHKKALESAYEAHTAHAKQQAAMQLSAETEKMDRELNRQLSVKELDMKRELSRRQEEYKDKLFAELQEKIETYRETKEYQQLLEKQIAEAVRFANGDELIVYLDPADESRAKQLKTEQKIDLKISDSSFGGGIRAVMPARKILIDNSFETKLREMRSGFEFDLGGKQRGKDW